MRQRADHSTHLLGLLMLAVFIAIGCSSSTTSPTLLTPTMKKEPLNPAILGGLTWLARHQSHDGKWDSKDFTRLCGQMPGGPCTGIGFPDYNAGNTSLALLAFLGAGFTPESDGTYTDKLFANAIRKGFRWLAAAQDDDGCIGGKVQTSVKYMYNHAFATLALCEVYGITKNTSFRDNADRAVRFLVAAQNPGKGWRYTSRCGDNDSSLTGLCVMALRSAKNVGFPVPPSCFEGATAWFNEATADDGHVGYVDRESMYITAGPEPFMIHATTTALGMTNCFLAEGKKDSLRLKSGMALLTKDLPRSDVLWVDLYYWHQGTVAMCLLDGLDGMRWKTWQTALLAALEYIKRHDSDGCRAGSWYPEDYWSKEGGRVYSTAINTLTLEICHQYESVYCLRMKP
jgi:hypothetical protein